MLGTLTSDEKTDWKQYVDWLVHAYNCTPHETTGVTPQQLLFGTKPKLPIDHVFNWSEDAQEKPAQEYVVDIQEQIVKTHELIQKQLDKSKDKQKSYYDRRAKPIRLEVGNQVLVKKLAFEGRHKIKDKYEPDTYFILEQPRPVILVITIRSLSEDEKIRTLHRNHL